MWKYIFKSSEFNKLKFLNLIKNLTRRLSGDGCGGETGETDRKCGALKMSKVH